MPHYSDIIFFGVGGAIGFSIALMSMFYLPQLFGHLVGYGVVLLYWSCVFGAGLIYGIPKYLRLRGTLSATERKYFWSGSKGAGVWWAMMTLLYSWPIALGTIFWLLGFQDPSGWYVLLLVITSWLWMLGINYFVLR